MRPRLARRMQSAQGCARARAGDVVVTPAARAGSVGPNTSANAHFAELVLVMAPLGVVPVEGPRRLLLGKVRLRHPCLPARGSSALMLARSAARTKSCRTRPSSVTRSSLEALRHGTSWCSQHKQRSRPDRPGREACSTGESVSFLYSLAHSCIGARAPLGLRSLAARSHELRQMRACARCELRRRAELDQATLVKHHDTIAVEHGIEPVRDSDHGAVRKGLTHASAHELIRGEVERGGRLREGRPSINARFEGWSDAGGGWRCVVWSGVPRP
jgi:hypothetical protein